MTGVADDAGAADDLGTVDDAGAGAGVEIAVVAGVESELGATGAGAATDVLDRTGTTEVVESISLVGWLF